MEKLPESQPEVNQVSKTATEGPVDSSDRTLGLISPWQVLRKLWWELQILNAIPNRGRLGVSTQNPLEYQDAWLYAAINAACTCVSLADWFFHTIKADSALTAKAREVLPNVSFRDHKKFVRRLAETNSAFRVCREVCNANKHFFLDYRQNELKIMVSEFLFTESGGEQYLTVKAHVIWNRDNSEATGDIKDILWSVANWWEELFSEVGIPDRLQFFPELKASNPDYDY